MHLFSDYVNKKVELDIRATLLFVMNVSPRVFSILISPLFGRIVDMYSLSNTYILLAIVFLLIRITCLHMFRNYQQKFSFSYYLDSSTISVNFEANNFI